MEMDNKLKLKPSEKTAMYDMKAFSDRVGDRGNIIKAVSELERIRNESRGMVNDYKVFRKYVPILLDLYYTVSEINNDYGKVLDEAGGKSQRNKNKRWTPEEDEMLIEYVVAYPDATDIELSTTFGRTTASIKTRISQLVGIGRISEQVAGRFVGTINGESVDGNIHGTVYKHKTKPAEERK